MKLKNLLGILFDLGMFDDNNTIYHKDLLKIHKHILKCEEFKYTDELTILEDNFYFKGGKKNSLEKNKLDDGLEFGEKCYIQKIIASEIMYSESDFNVPVLNGACITPVTYDPFFYIPKRKIIIEITSEDGISKFSDDKYKEELITLFINILNSPEKYMHEECREFTIVGKV
jgi:hypothetical protein